MKRLAALTLAKRTALANRLGVVTSETGGSTARLLAFATVRRVDNDTSASSDEVHAWLKQRLPEHLIPAELMVLDTMPRLANGKVDLAALPGLARNVKKATGSLDAASNAIEETLIRIWCDVLGSDRIGIHDNFFEVGGDSIRSIQIVSRAHQEGLVLGPTDVLEYPTIAELAVRIKEKTTPKSDDSLVVHGEVPLTPIQHWFFEQNLAHGEQWNQAVVLDLPVSIQTHTVRGALDRLTAMHAALRTSFPLVDGRRIQHVAQQATVPLVERNDGSPVTDTMRDAAAHAQSEFRLDQAPLLHATVSNQDGRRLMLLVAHHLVIDALSWQMIIDDLDRLCRGSGTDRPEPVSKSVSYGQWAQRLQAYAQGQQALTEGSYWIRAMPTGCCDYPVDGACDDAPTEGHTKEFEVVLEPEQTLQLLNDTHQAYNTTVQDLLLTAMAGALRDWTGRNQNVIGLEGHGREPLFDELDLSRTIGWFTSFYPLCLDLRNAAAGDAAMIKRIKERIRAVPGRGIGYGILRYLRQDDEVVRTLQEQPPIRVLFNYLGHVDQISSPTSVIRVVPADVGPLRHPDNARSHLLDVDARVAGGQLQVVWRYDARYHHTSTVENLGSTYAQCLRRLIQHCLDPNAHGYTPSDFTDAGLEQDELDDFLRRIT